MKVFLSYNTQEGADVAPLYDQLSAIGFDCFMAHRDLRQGEEWQPAILDRLSVSDVFIAILSELGRQSYWVHQECGMAHLLRRLKGTPVIVPIISRGSVPPGCISIYQGLQLEGDGKRAVFGMNAGQIIGRDVALQGNGEEVRRCAISAIASADESRLIYILEFLRDLRLSGDEFVALFQACEMNLSSASGRVHDILSPMGLNSAVELERAGLTTRWREFERQLKTLKMAELVLKVVESSAEKIDASIKAREKRKANET